jgi:predicted transcriptional regulator
MVWENTAERWEIAVYVVLMIIVVLITGIVPLFLAEEDPARNEMIRPFRPDLLSFNSLLLLGIRNGRRKELLENSSRRRIYECISANPGIGFHELERMTGISTGALRYHLDRLSQMGVISKMTSGAGLAFFPSNLSFSTIEQQVIKHQRNTIRNVILMALREEKNCTRKDLAMLVGTSEPAISWHMKRLAADRIVVQEKEGRVIKFRLAEGVEDILDSKTLP